MSNRPRPRPFRVVGVAVFPCFKIDRVTRPPGVCLDDFLVADLARRHASRGVFRPFGEPVPAVAIGKQFQPALGGGDDVIGWLHRVVSCTGSRLIIGFGVGFRRFIGAI